MFRNTVFAAMLATTTAIAGVNAAEQQSIEFFQTQSATQMMASQYIGQTVKGPSGKELGDINNLVMNSDGNVEAAVIGVGGFLGVGEKNVAIPFENITQKTDENGELFILVNLSKQQLETAPVFKSTEPGLMTKIEKSARKYGEKAKEVAKDAKQKVEEMSEAAKENAGKKPEDKSENTTDDKTDENVTEKDKTSL